MSDQTQSTHIGAESTPVPTLWIKEVVRFPEQGPEDRLTFSPGLNVLVGVPNTGKSKWLRMIDYLFGDDNKAVDAFGDEIANKYDSLRATIMIGVQEWVIVRNWKEPGLLTKISVNDESMTLHAFSAKLMNALQIPILHYPQGNPYSTRTWPELGWRSLYRHMYLRQAFWSDLAERQPPSEQHACMLQFVGIAEIIFSEQYGQMIGLEKQIQQLQNSREQFVALLQEVSRELLDTKGLEVALTPDSIAAAIEAQEAKIVELQKQRQSALQMLLNKAVNTESSAEPNASKDVVEKLGQELTDLRVKEESVATAISKTDERLSEVRVYHDLITEELGRMERAMQAGSLLADLKITNCPACDRPIAKEEQQSENCVLCKRPIDVQTISESPTKRLNYELDQLRDEVKETDQLLNLLGKEADRLSQEYTRLHEQIVGIQTQLMPVRIAAASVLPPELTILDQQTGRLHEKVAQLKRVRSTLDKRETIASEITNIQSQVAKLNEQLAMQSKNVSFERVGDLYTDGMNTYLNAINDLKPNSWTQNEVDVIIHDKAFAIRIGKSDWRVKLGGTLTLFFMIAYHYALMSLTGKKQCHYPGLCILDFPAQLDGVTVSASENFVLEPFLRLINNPDEIPLQVIAAGSSFSGLLDANRIQFSKVWT